MELGIGGFSVVLGSRSFYHGTSTGSFRGPFARHPPSSRGHAIFGEFGSSESRGAPNENQLEGSQSALVVESVLAAQLGQDTTSAIHSNLRGMARFAGSDTGKGPIAVGESHGEFVLQDVPAIVGFEADQTTVMSTDLVNIPSYFFGSWYRTAR
ncbi:hypothetical protein Salat_1688100 [Sesamum alatum]|uniref:Uncharacterized protein n=1 Tax=Sesamum alatum TaxID=300844 RepID=A0AAE1Y754_9LAMI|nr:hypothetical protein Salat_1688100 [Sesamum alatum]